MCVCSLTCMHGRGIPREENSCDIKVEVGLTGKRKNGTSQRGLGSTGDGRGSDNQEQSTKHVCEDVPIKPMTLCANPQNINNLKTAK